MRGNPWRWSRARHSAGTVRRRRTMDAVLRLVSDGVNADRKRIGSGSDILHAHPCAALSQEKLRIRPYKEPVREGIQSPRATAHVLARLTDSTNSPVLLSASNDIALIDGELNIGKNVTVLFWEASTGTGQYD